MATARANGAATCILTVLRVVAAGWVLSTGLPVTSVYIRDARLCYSICVFWMALARRKANKSWSGLITTRAKARRRAMWTCQANSPSSPTETAISVSTVPESEALEAIAEASERAEPVTIAVAPPELTETPVRTADQRDLVDAGHNRRGRRSRHGSRRSCRNTEGRQGGRKGQGRQDLHHAPPRLSAIDRRAGATADRCSPAQAHRCRLNPALTHVATAGISQEGADRQRCRWGTPDVYRRPGSGSPDRCRLP